MNHLGSVGSVRRISWRLAGVVLLMALGGAASCTSAERTSGAPDSASSSRRADTGRAQRERSQAPRPPAYAVRDALQAAGPEAAEALEHVVTLSSEFFEGRAADTRGDELAAEYIAFQFRRLGLTPAFISGSQAGASHGDSYTQPFTVNGGLDLTTATLAFARRGAGAFELGADFHPLGFSANGRAAGPLVFAGYSVADGPKGYESYKANDDLTGAIAMVLRFEPLDESGKSRWNGDGEWTRHAGLAGKIKAAADRGASAVLLVNTPGAADPRAEFLETHQSTNLSAEIGVPVVHVSSRAAQRLIAGVCPTCPSLVELREGADRGETGATRLGDAGASLMVHVEFEREHVPTANVGAILEGRGALRDEYVVVGGHYDHLGYGHFSSRDPKNAGKVHPGADDNASGIAAILIAARLLREEYTALPPDADRRSILFLAFSGEEVGLLGSEHFMNQTSLSSEDMTAMVNLDMIGRIEKNRLTISGTGTSPIWDDMLDAAAERHGFKLRKSRAGIGASDHTTFYRASVPALHLFSGIHDDYHTVRDTFDTLSYVGCARVARFTADLAGELASMSDQLAFQSTGDSGIVRPRGKSKVRLGIMPATYAETDLPGVQVGDVFDGTSAGNAGMRGGDRIIRWGDKEVPDIRAMMTSLAEHKPGDKVDIVVVREGAEVTLNVELLARE